MVIEFERGMNKNYMITEADDKTNYAEELLKNIEIEGLINFQPRIINNEKKYYYEITGGTSLGSVAEKVFESTESTVYFFDSLFTILGNAGKYLLEENDFMLSSEQIFVFIKDFSVRLCYCPGYSRNMREQFVALVEYVMNNIDYAQKDTVSLVHELYLKSRENDSSLSDLVMITERFKSNFSGKYIKADNEIKQTEKDNITERNRHREEGRITEKNRCREESGTAEKDRNRQKNRYTEEKYDIEKNEYTKEKTYIEAGKTESVRQKRTTQANKLKLAANYGLDTDIERETEQLYYPLKCHITIVAMVVISVIIVIMLCNSQLLLNDFKTGLDYGKLLGIIIVMGLINVIVAGSVYSEKNRRSRMVIYENISEKETGFSGDDMILRTEKLQNATEEGESFSYCTEDNEMHKEENGNERKASETIVLEEYFKEKIEVVYPAFVPGNNSIYKKIEVTDFPFYIGKLETKNNVVIPSPAVSRYHAKLEQTEDGCIIRDLSSTNGTFINGVRLGLNESALIKDGDRISFADAEYIFSCPATDDVVK